MIIISRHALRHSERDFVCALRTECPLVNFSQF